MASQQAQRSIEWTGLNDSQQTKVIKSPDGAPVVWVFQTPGRIFKERWAAFTNREEFLWKKGTREEVELWAEEYARNLLSPAS